MEPVEAYTLSMISRKSAKDLLLDRILYPDSLCSLDDCPSCYLYWVCHSEPNNGIPWEQRKDYAIKTFIDLYGEEELFEVLL